MKRRTLLAALALLPALAWADVSNVVLVLGDSLSAEYGLRRDSGWVKLLADRLDRLSARPSPAGGQFSVVNASISGETTSGGRARLAPLLETHRPRVVVIALGANDGLRGLSLLAMRANLRAMVHASRAAGAQVLLVGMRLPPNYGPDYSEKFFQSFAQVAQAEKVALTPFLLEGFAEDSTLFQADRIHPLEAAQGRMLENVWPQLRKILGVRP